MSSSDLSEWASEDDTPTLVRPTFKSKTDEAEWERKQRNREYRVAARREKRNRKADEKKQRKLNATILRRMTKNPDKYNKNVDRNRRRDIEMERRKIYREAVSQAERLAAIHDPSGKMFNVGPVVVQEDGKVVSVEFLEKRAQAQAERAAKLAQGNDGANAQISGPAKGGAGYNTTTQSTNGTQDSINPARRGLISVSSSGETKTKRLSKNQQKKLALLEERPPPAKPVMPNGVELPEGEENWLALWDLSDDELERRVIREKKRKAAERKALREKQKEGKAERRAARDERRRVYREKKLEWKAIKEQEKVQKRKLLRVEQEEAKRIEIEVNLAERQRAMEVCAELGFNLDNVEGVADIKPKALGMRGQEVDFDALEIGGRPSELRIKDEKRAKELKDGKARSNRVDLGKVADESKTRVLISEGAIPAGMEGDFVSLEFGSGAMDGRQFEELNFNHKLRRKLHRAIEAAQIQKELLVRAKAKEYCESKGIDVPPELAAEYKPIRLAGKRILEDGSLETEKQERVRKRLELAEYNKAAKVLRQQAKAEAIEAGLRVFAELTGKKPSDANEAHQNGEYAQVTSTTNDIVEHDNKSVNLNSKKRRREDEDSDTKKVKKSRKSSASALASGVEAGEVQTQVRKAKKQEPSELTTSHITNVEVGPNSTPDGRKIKAKKWKTSYNLENQVDGSNQVAEDDAARKERKRLKKEHKRQNADGDDLPEVASQNDAAPEASTRMSKKSKRQKSEPVDTSTTNVSGSERRSVEANWTGEGEVNAQSGDQWNPEALEGDVARKDKFLRLLGASKVNGNSTAKPAKKLKAKAKMAGLVQMENELERQFEAGIRMRHDGQRKRGLGA